MKLLDRLKSEWKEMPRFTKILMMMVMLCLIYPVITSFIEHVSPETIVYDGTCYIVTVQLSNSDVHVNCDNKIISISGFNRGRITEAYFYAIVGEHKGMTLPCKTYHRKWDDYEYTRCVLDKDILDKEILKYFKRGEIE